MRYILDSLEYTRTLSVEPKIPANLSHTIQALILFVHDKLCSFFILPSYHTYKSHVLGTSPAALLRGNMVMRSPSCRQNSGHISYFFVSILPVFIHGKCNMMIKARLISLSRRARSILLTNHARTSFPRIIFLF